MDPVICHKVNSTGSSTSVIIIPGPSYHLGSFSSFAKGGKMGPFVRVACNLVDSDLKLQKYQLRILPKARLAEKSIPEDQKPSKGRLRDMANAAGFWICITQSHSKPDDSAMFLSGDLDKPVPAYSDEFGMKIEPPLKLKDCVVAESKFTRVFLDVQARPMLYVSVVKPAKSLSELNDETLEDLFQTAVSITNKTSEKELRAENAEGNGQPAMDQSTDVDKFEEMQINTKMDKSQLHVKVLKDPSSFRHLWGSDKNFLALQKVSPSRGNKENEQSQRSQTTEISRKKPGPSVPAGAGTVENEKVSVPTEETKTRKGGKAVHEKGLGRGAVRRLEGRQTGTCKWFNTIKGYGFILPEEGTDDIFVHQTAIKAHGFRSLAENERVEFNVEVDANGRKKARNVTSVGGGFVQGAPFVHPGYIMRPRPYVPMPRGGYNRGGYPGGGGGGGGAEEMYVPSQEQKGYQKSSGFPPRFHGRGRGGGSAVDFTGGGNGQVENYPQPNRYPTYQGYGQDYYGAGYQHVYGYGSQQYIVPSPVQQPRGTSGILNSMQSLQLQPMPPMGVGRAGMPMQGSPQQPPMYNYAPAMPPLDGGRGGGRRGRSGANGGKSGSKEQS
uniref:CSD domain-containing protein n=1 Tax=Lotharella oceanica TaxID=641309 RepID=A0A7S2X6X2_9EUKA